MTTLSKRQQARNERALQDMIKTVPGNDKCADCGARNPGWASWSLGIFLCMRCASLHRKLGTHISKVKSLSMDSWTNEQVENMRRNGNVVANKTYNPQNTKPQIPLDVDEVEITLEKFIRQKYDQQMFAGASGRRAMRDDTGNTGNTASTRSSEDRPPPLPPKPGKRFGFGFRSTSSVLPASHKSNHTPPRSPDGFNGPPSPMRANKQSRVFGTNIGSSGDDTEAKLVQLREMGFADDKRNLTVLQGHGGNLERTIESLVRLGEGSAPTSRSRTPLPARGASVQPTQASAQSIGATNGLSFSNAATLPPTNTASTGLAGKQTSLPLENQSARSLSPSNPFQSQIQAQPYNPFNALGQQPQQQHAIQTRPLEQSFQDMQISQQPLFPNVTGGFPSQPPPIQDPRIQTMTPPVPQIPQQFIQPQFFQPPVQSPSNDYNPFFSPPLVQEPTSAFNQQQSQSPSYMQPHNPFQQQNAPTQQSQLNQYTATSPPVFSTQSPQGNFQQPLGLQPNMSFPQGQNVPQFTQTNPFQPLQHSFTSPMQFDTNSAISQQQQASYQSQQLPPLFPQQTGRLDKSSILALYNLPHSGAAPLPLGNAQISNADPPTPVPQAHNPTPQSSNGPPPPPPPPPTQGRRSVTMPAQLTSTPGSRNPFQSNTTPNATNVPTNHGVGSSNISQSRHVTQESVDVGGYQNGRHSPDAFANLSARYVR